MYQLRYNSRTYHLEGMTGRTCGTLTRYMHTLAYGAQTFDDLGAALRNARIAARVNNMRVCGNCEEYAEKALSETDRNAQHYVNTLQSLDAGTDVQLYTFDGHTLAGVIADHGPEALKLTSVQGDPITVAYVDIEQFEFYDHAAENWIDPVTEAHAAAPDSTLTAAVRHFVCLSCGATDEGAECITGPVHTAPRRMLPDDFQRYMASRRPVDKDAAAARREAIRAARAQLDRHAEEAVEFDLAASEEARIFYLTARIAMAAGRTLRSCDGSELRPHVIAPAYTIAERVDEAANRFGVFVEGKFTVYADTLADAVASVPAALAAVAAAGEPGDYAAADCIIADLHECWSRALCDGILLIDVEETETPAPEHARLALAVGRAYTTDNTEPEPGMTKFEVVLTQVVTTTVYVEAPDREAAVDLAVTELPELCGQCAGDRPRASANITDVHTSIADTYGEPEVTELDEYGRVKATPAAAAAAAATFARVMTAESIKRDGAWGADDGALAPVRDNDDEEAPRG